MQRKQLVIDYMTMGSKDELSESDRMLLECAEKMLPAAYAPYSHYHVGAALLLANGEIVTGSNQENMAFPSGLCAERVAIFAASAKFPGVAMKALSITAKSNETPVNEPVTPCGACRQAIIEYENNQSEPIRVILGSDSNSVMVFESMNNLLPFSFRGEGLKKVAK